MGTHKKIVKEYYKRIFYLALSKPKKIPALYRLKTGAQRLTARNLLARNYNALPPITIAIRPTYRCNLNCVQCGQWGERGYLKHMDKLSLSKDSELSTEEWKKFISEVAPFKPYIYFTGGEPLLRKDIFELISFASSKNLITSISTNGTLLSDNADKLVRSGLDYLYVSLDGTKEINDAIRIGQDSSRQTIDGIKSVLSSREQLNSSSPILEIRTTLTRENQNALLDTAKFVDKELKVEVFCIAFPVFTTKDLDIQTKKMFKDELNVEEKCWESFLDGNFGINIKNVEQQMKKIKETNWNFVFHPYKPIDTRDFVYDLYFNHPEKTIGNVHFCAGLYSFTQLQPNGDVATCATVPDYIAGNILKDKFMDIWNGEKYKKIRKATSKNLFPTCSRCKHVYTFKAYR